MIKKLRSSCSFAIAALVILMLLPGIGRGQTAVSYTGMGSITCPTAPTATIAPAVTGLTFTQLSRGSGVTCASASTGISGSSFNTTLAAALTGSKWYTYSITSDANVSFTVSSINVVSQVSSATGSPSVSVQYSIGAGAKIAIGSFTPTASSAPYTITPASPIAVTASQTINIFIVPNTLTAAGTTCRVNNNSSITVTTTPVATTSVTATGTFTPFATTVGTPSASQPLAVSGTNLTSTIEVLALSGYEYSTTNADPWTSTLSLASSFSGSVYARLTGTSLGNYNGNVSFTSTGATQVDKAVTGVVNPLTPVINVTGTFSAFSTIVGTPSASQSVAVSGSNLTSTIEVLTLAGYEYSTNNAAPWSSTLSLASSFSGSLYARLTGASIGSPAGNISFTSTGANQVDKAVSGTVTAPPPVITVTGAFSVFTTSVGTPSASQSVTVLGSNLTAGIGISAVTGYEYSTNDAAPWTTTLSLASNYNGTVFARLTGASGGSPSGTVSFTSSGATQIDKTVNGTVNFVAAALPLYENFNFTDNSLLTANGWGVTSAGANPLAVGASNGLSYSGYSGVSGITGVAEGNAVKVVNNGEDDSKTFIAVTSGTVYLAFLTNVTTGAAGYYIHLGGSTSAFAARIFVKPSATAGKFNLGISNTGTASFASTPTDFDLNTTYLLIVKYDVSTTGAASLWVKSTGVPSSEIAAGTAECTTTGTGQASIDRICLRQYSATQSMLVDGIRIGTSWADIIPPTTTTFTGTGDWSTSSNWSDGIPTSAMDAFIDGNVTVDVAAETKDLTIINYQTVTISDTKSLTVNGTITNLHGASGLVVNSGGSLITNNSVLATVNRDFSGGTNFHYFCLPVSGASIGASPTFDGAWLDEYVEISGEWNRLGNADNVVSGKGYSINYEAVNTPLSFSGSINTVDHIAGSLTYTVAASGYGPGWHLLGNPFTAALDLNSSSWVMDNVDAYAYVWDGSNYLTGPTSPPDANGYIYGTLTDNVVPAMQGFFVHATAGNASLTIPAAARTHNNQSFYKSTKVAKDALFLTIKGNGYQDKAIVAFNPSATENFDGQYDAYKLFGIVEAPQLYSILPGEKATVNTLPDYTTNSNVALGLKVGASTSYTINVSGIESFDASLPVRLDDLKLGTSQDLRVNPVYTFDAAPGDAENRFMLSFASVTAVKEQNAAGIKVVTDNGIIRVTHNAPATGTVYLYSVSGQLLATSSLNKGETTLQAASTGVYLVKVVTGKTSLTRKMVVVK